MERINANEVQSMMEAYASIYNNQEQEVISEEVAETEELQENQANRDKQRELRQQQSGGNRAQQQLGPKGASYSWADRRKFRRSSSAAAQANTNRVGQNIKVGSPTGPAQNDQLKKPTATGTAPAAPTSMANKAGAERRLPTSAELRAAQQARRDAPKVLSRGEIENRAVQAGVGVSKGTVPDPKIAADAARKAKLAALQAKAKADTMAKAKTAPDTSRMSGRNRARMEEVDIFDTIKEYLIGEGATEEEALKQMLTLTDEQRTEILEGNRRPFSDAGEYPMRDAMRDAGMNRAPHAPVVPVKKAKKKPTVQMAGYEPEGELVDEGSCGSKPKKKGGKK